MQTDKQAYKRTYQHERAVILVFFKIIIITTVFKVYKQKNRNLK